MDFDKMQVIVGVSLPFGFAMFVQMISERIKVFAERSIRIFDSGIQLTRVGEELPVRFGIFIFSHLSFILGLCSSVVSCIALTLVANRPIFAAVGGVLGMMPLISWVVLWQGLSDEDLRGTKGRVMRVCGYLFIILVWAISLYAQLNPVAVGPSAQVGVSSGE